VAKGGKFQDYTDFFIKRGTGKNDDWMNSVTNSHTMAKTKYNWGAEDLSIKSFATEEKKREEKEQVVLEVVYSTEPELLCRKHLNR